MISLKDRRERWSSELQSWPWGGLSRGSVFLVTWALDLCGSSSLASTWLNPCHCPKSLPLGITGNPLFLETPNSFNETNRPLSFCFFLQTKTLLASLHVLRSCSSSDVLVASAIKYINHIAPSLSSTILLINFFPRSIIQSPLMPASLIKSKDFDSTWKYFLSPIAVMLRNYRLLCPMNLQYCHMRRQRRFDKVTGGPPVRGLLVAVWR